LRQIAFVVRVALVIARHMPVSFRMWRWRARAPRTVALIPVTEHQGELEKAMQQHEHNGEEATLSDQ
jgi:hypothetical protein